MYLCDVGDLLNDYGGCDKLCDDVLCLMCEI